MYLTKRRATKSPELILKRAPIDATLHHGRDDVVIAIFLDAVATFRVRRCGGA